MKLTRVLLTALLVPAGIALVACGSDDDVLLDDGLVQPPPVASGGASSSSSSSGAAASSSGAPSNPDPTGDGGGGSSSSGGAPVEAACDPAANLQPAVELGEFPAGAGWVRLSGDELTVYFSQQQPAGGPKIFSMTRASRGASFANLVELGANVNRSGGSWGPLPSDDDLELVFINANIAFKATRTSRDQPFGPSAPAGGLDIMPLSTRETAASGLGIFSHWEKVFPTHNEPKHWVLFSSANGTSTRLGGPALPSWYEASTKRLWIESSANTYQRRWNGSSWQDNGAQVFKVTWSSPSGCRLYGIAGDKVQMQARVP